MSIVMTLCVKDEEDILDAQLAFHLNAGVDFVIVTDTGSTDGTLDILEPYRRAGVLELRHDDTRPFRQGQLRTAMARAAHGRGAEWVFSSDADEFWWPRGRNLKDVFEALPPRYGIVSGIWRSFVPRPEDGRPFYERMTARLAAAHAINDPRSAFRPNVKVAHRAHAGVQVGAGNHSVTGLPFSPLRGWYPIEVLHFPMRTEAQTSRKYELALGYVGPDQAGYIRRFEVAGGGEAGGESFDAHVIDDTALQEGLKRGVLAEDVRLRDALRTLLGPDGRFALAADGDALLAFPVPSVVDDAVFAEDVAVLGEADLVRAQRTLDDLERRLHDVEQRPAVRVSRRLRSLALRLRPRR
jgi:Glycosyl transferase family 2